MGSRLDPAPANNCHTDAHSGDGVLCSPLLQLPPVKEQSVSAGAQRRRRCGHLIASASCVGRIRISTRTVRSITVAFACYTEMMLVGEVDSFLPPTAIDSPELVSVQRNHSAFV